jgi:O-antigen/teichoic acid export membrane protein
MSNGPPLQTRYFYKLLANLVGLFINVGIQAIVPRGLGPEAYGSFHFLTNFFSQVTGFLDLGTSTGFYVKLSQRQKDHGLITFYLLFMVLAMTILFALVVASSWADLTPILWPEQELRYIYMAALWSALTWISNICTKVGDAYGLTVSIEKIRIMQKVLGLIVVAGLFFSDILSLETFFFYHYFTLIFLTVGQIWVMLLAGRLLWPLVRPTFANMFAYGKELYHYSHPLVVFMLVGAVTMILDRWLLQRFSGSLEQGFYSLAYQIGAICILFTSAMTPLIQREFAIAFENKNMQEMSRLFRRYIPLLYFVAAFLACFIVIHAQRVTFFLGGDTYADAILATTIMVLFPIHQTYGQLNGSVFYATGQTGMYRNIGVVFMLIGLPITYFLIAPTEQHGLELGAAGLAVKMVGLQFIAVNVQLYYNVKTLKLSFLHFFGHQIVSLLVLLLIAFGSEAAASTLITANDLNGMILGFLLSGIIYTAGVLLLVYRLPKIVGLKQEDVQRILRYLHPG